MDGIRWFLRFVGPGQRLVWVGLSGLALVVTGFEIVSIVLVFLVVRLIADPSASLELPFVGDVRTWFPQASDVDLLVALTGVVAAVFILRSVLALAQSYLQSRVAEKTGVRLASRLFDGYLRMPYSFHLKRSSSDLMHKVIESTQEVVTYILLPVARLGSEALVVVGLSLALIVAAPVAALIAFVVFGSILIVLLRIVQPRVASLGAESHSLNHQSMQTVQQSLHAFRDIVMFGRTEFFHRMFLRDREGVARTRYLREFFGDLPRATLETGVMVFVFLYVVVATRAGDPPPEVLAVLGMFAYAALRILPSLNRAVLLTNDMKYGGAAAEAVHRDLTAISEAASGVAPDGGSPPGRRLPFRHELRLSGVAHRYPDADGEALTDADLHIEQGEAIGIVGPSGGGKTTLVDVILGLLQPARGAVLVDGSDIRSDLDAWQMNLGVVSQSVYILDETLRRNIAFGLDDDEIDEARVHEAVRLAQLADFVRSLPEGLDTRVGERGDWVSGGQRQRLAIARALYRQPSVLVLDEGTSALDMMTEAELIAALEELRGDHTIIIVAHRLSTVRWCDRIVYIDAGRVVDVGEWEALRRRNPGFRHLVS